MKKFTIVFTILAILIVMISCKNEPQPVFKPEESEPIIWTEIKKISYLYYLNDGIGYDFDSEIHQDSFSYKLKLHKIETVDYDSEVGTDYKLLDLDGNWEIIKYEGYLEYHQPDEGLGERNWHIKFTALADKCSISKSTPEEREELLARRPAPNQMRMFIYNAHGVDEYGNPISDEELGWKAELLNGWLAVEFSDFLASVYYPDPITDWTTKTKTCYEYRDFSCPETFSLITTDISDMTEESAKLSALPAFDNRIIGLKFKTN